MWLEPQGKEGKGKGGRDSKTLKMRKRGPRWIYRVRLEFLPSRVGLVLHLNYFATFSLFCIPFFSFSFFLNMNVNSQS